MVPFGHYYARKARLFILIFCALYTRSAPLIKTVHSFLLERGWRFLEVGDDVTVDLGSPMMIVDIDNH